MLALTQDKKLIPQKVSQESCGHMHILEISVNISFFYLFFLLLIGVFGWGAEPLEEHIEESEHE